ncbi:hypothetical protein ASPCAL00572 [Aspergillus calidoustus]|uniref:Uncharacterized protein n=1 Tax=Aspergillus calidoustus TaxID=454130 RepID=A0A0U5GJR6_ASPCI|nr:hypothetical protein ASPCAL00572 [Aspergillus calidoustus]
MPEPSNAKTHWTRGEKDRVTRLSKSLVDDEYLSDYASENDQSALQSSAKKRKFDETDVDAADEDLKTRSKMVKPFGIATNVEEYDFHASHGTKRAFIPESVSIHADDTTGGEDEWSTDLEYIEEVKYDDGDHGKEGEADGEDGGEKTRRELWKKMGEKTPREFATISRVNASATVTGSSGASAAAMAIKAVAGAPPRHATETGELSFTTEGAQTPDGWPRGYRSLSQPAADSAASNHPRPTVRCVATSHNGTGTPTSYQPQNVSFASTTSYQPGNASFTSGTQHVNNWTAINRSTGGITPTSWQPLQDSFTRARTSSLLAAESSLYKGISQLITRPTTEKASAVEAPTSTQIHRESALRINLSSLVGNSQAPEHRPIGPPIEDDAHSRAVTFGEVLEVVEKEKEAEHLEIEEEIRGLEQQIEILREQSKAAKSQSARAGELLDRLQLPGGWADLNPFEVFDLISGVVGSEADNAGEEPKTF